MGSGFDDVVARLRAATLRREVVAAIADVRDQAPSAPEAAVAFVRDPAWDELAPAVRKWSNDHPKRVVWQSLFAATPTLDLVDRLWFLTEHPDTALRNDFVMDAITTGPPELLDRARALIEDGDDAIRRHAALGVRNAMMRSTSIEFVRTAVVLLAEYVVAFPQDRPAALVLAIDQVSPQLAAEVRKRLSESESAGADPNWTRLVPGGPPWGDYGRILVHGIAWNLDRTDDGLARLERTGPFIPPLTLPGGSNPIVTAEAREALTTSGLRGCAFQPVVVARVVNLPWHEWDLQATSPARYPAGGEPENYVLRRKHNPTIAAAMPALFELVLTEADPSDQRPDSLDLVQTRDAVFLSAAARAWIEPRWGEWLQFAPDHR